MNRDDRLSFDARFATATEADRQTVLDSMGPDELTPAQFFDRACINGIERPVAELALYQLFDAGHIRVRHEPFGKGYEGCSFPFLRREEGSAQP